MSDTVTRQFVTQFDTDLRLLAQQKNSRLRGTVFDRGTITGASFTINNLDKVEMDENTVRHGDTIWSDIDHTARTVRHGAGRCATSSRRCRSTRPTSRRCW